ncbi:phosphoenolpyruvate-protein phosphotransferase [Spirochaetia bacterium]|nr:phosphoenolpyruvate-protein phosphotransferase [Spirochaetia bacterium]
MKTLSGVPVSSGIVSGEAFLHVESEFPEIVRYSLNENQIEAELKRLDKAITESLEDLRAVYERALREMSKDLSDIFAAHIMMLEDPDFIDQLRTGIQKTLQNAECVVSDIARGMMQKMMASPDPLFRERAVDINDISRRILTVLLGIKQISLSELDRDVIVVAHDLLPSEVLTMNKAHVKGFVMDGGGRTSHTAILARAFNIPAVLGLSIATKEIKNDDMLVVDGSAGQVTINPDQQEMNAYKKAGTQYRKKQDEFLTIRDLSAETTDGCRVALKANIEIPEEAEQVLHYGAEGIGLYRSEFLFLTPGQAAEEEMQYQAYCQVLKALGGLPVTIRTMDIGGDKILPDFQVTSDERNPLLGWRAIRFSLALPELFKTQLRAILRSSVHGNVRIMFPLISCIEELEQARVLLDEARAECRAKAQPFADNIEVGVMIEVPSAAMTADILARSSDFFSIGTNDLIQYSLAVDRGNERVNYLAQPCHPAVLRFIKTTIDAAHQKGIKAAMCGELAGDSSMTALLLGLGLDEFSMTAQSIPQVKGIVRAVSMKDCQKLAEEVMKGTSWKQNAALVSAWMAKNFPAE